MVCLLRGSIMKKKIFTTDFIVKVGILSAIEIIFAFISQFITIGPASINLALIPIAFGAIMFGPICGGFLGFLNGAMVLASPETQAYFMDTNVFGDWCIFGTILICLLKCTAAGVASGFIYKLLKNKNEIVAIVVASFIVPLILIEGKLKKSKSEVLSSNPSLEENSLCLL